MKIELKRNLPRYAFLAAVSVVFLLLYSVSTSPLTIECGSDSSFFILVGQGMTRGMLPYRDFYDMKGPYLFLIEYLGQLICYGRTGAFVMQCVNLFVSLCIVDRILWMQLRETRRALLYEAVYVAVFLAIAALTLNGGNLTEEYSLPWLLLALYFALRYLKQSEATGDYRHPLGMGFYYGFAFGIQALIRVTNAAAIGAIILTISVGLLVKREFKNLLLNGAMFILGTAAACLPLFVYYGLMGELGKLITQVFLFGVQYSAESTFTAKLYTYGRKIARRIVCSLLPVAVLAVYRVKNWRYWLLSVSSFLTLLLAVLMGNAYLHYFTLGLPNLVLGFVLLQEQLNESAAKPPVWRNLRRVLAAVLVAATVAGQWSELGPFLAESQTLRGWQTNRKGVWSREMILDIKAQIPESDYDSVFVYGLFSCSNWYVQAGLLPCNRYCDWQEHYVSLNSRIGDELEEYLVSETPAWVVLTIDHGVAPERMAQALEAHYEEYYRNGQYILLRADRNTQK